MTVESKTERMLSRTYAAYDLGDFPFATHLCRRILAQWQVGEEELHWAAALLLAETLKARGRLDAALIVACEVGRNGGERSAQARAVVGNIFSQWERREAAEGAYRAALAATAPGSLTSVYVHVILAGTIAHFWGLPRLAEVGKLARTAIGYQPDYDETYLVLAESLFAAGRYGEAEQALSEAIRLDPEDARHHELYARIVSRMPDVPRAVRLLEARQNDGGEQWWLLADLGRLQWIRGEVDAAVLSLGKAAGSAPVQVVGGAGVKNVLGVWPLYADLTLQSGAFEDTIRILDESANFSQEVAHWWLVRAELLAQFGDEAESQRCFKTAKALLETELRYAPTDYVRLQFMGRALAGLGEHAAKTAIDSEVEAILRDLSECCGETP